MIIKKIDRSSKIGIKINKEPIGIEIKIEIGTLGHKVCLLT